MPGGSPVVLSTKFRGLNRLLADYMLEPGESPDCADTAAYQGIGSKLGPRAGRKPIQNVSFPIRGVVPLNLSWLKLQLIATADGIITPYTINDPLYFNDTGSWIAFNQATGNYIGIGNGWFDCPEGPIVSPSTWTYSADYKTITNNPTNNTGPRAYLYASFSSGAGSVSCTVHNTGGNSISATLYAILASSYHSAADLTAGTRWAGTPLNLAASAQGTVSFSPGNAGTYLIAAESIEAFGSSSTEFDFVFTP